MRDIRAGLRNLGLLIWIESRQSSLDDWDGKFAASEIALVIKNVDDWCNDSNYISNNHIVAIMIYLFKILGKKLMKTA